MSNDNKRPHLEDHEEHEEHIDERWLVSYSDMMTLLFGLFVMLFSMADEHKGNMEQQLKAISAESFALNEIPTPTPKPEPTPDTKELQSEIEKLRAQVASQTNLQKDVQVMQDELQKQVTQATDLQVQLKIKDEELKNVQAKLEEQMKPKREIASVMPMVPQEQMDAVANKAKVAESKAEKLVAEKQDLEKKLKQQQKQLEELQAKTEPPKVLPAKKDIDPKILQAKLEQTQTQLDKVEEQLKQLQQEEKQRKPFLMFLVKWTTEKHDVDMVVTDPSGHVYNFKKRKYEGVPGEFTLDSRSGPGAEIWQADSFLPGTYTVKVNLYETYGNSNPAEVYTSIVSTVRRVALPLVKLYADGKREVTFKIQVGEHGAISVVN